MYRRRFFPLVVGLAAALGAWAMPPQIPVAGPRVVSGISPRAKAPRRASAGTGHVLPGKKGCPQKQQGKACRHGKTARQHRRAMRLKRG